MIKREKQKERHDQRKNKAVGFIPERLLLFIFTRKGGEKNNMASISTSIAIYDKVSAPINNMIGALTDMCDAFESVERSMGKGFDTSKIVTARAAIDRAAQSVVQLGKNTDSAEGEQKQYNNAVKSGASGVDSLVDKVTGLVAAYASIQTVQKAVELSDTMTQTSARLGLINETYGSLQSVEDIEQKIFESAQRSRGAYQETANSVAKLGQTASDAFSGTDEIIAFTELLNKNFVVGGASATEQASAMYQLTQAMGSGRLQGDEYRSIIENAPLLARSIEDYMRNVQGATGTMKEWAAEGLLTADVIKAAVFNSADEVEQKFSEMPMTWGQAMTMIKNQALMTFQPVLEKINGLINNEEFQQKITNVMTGLANVANFALSAIDIITSVASFMYDNWSLLEPIVWGLVFALGAWILMLGIAKAGMLIHSAVTAISAMANGTWTWSTFAQTAAQHGLNAALLACPLVWIIMLIIAVIAVIYLVIAAINKVTDSTISATGVICGAVAWLGATIWNIFVGLVNAIIQFVWAHFVEPFIGIIEWILNACNGGFTSFGGAVANLIGQIISWFLSLGKVVTTIIDAIFGTDWTGGINSLQDKVTAWGKDEEASISISREAPTLKRLDATDAYNSGYDFGAGLADKFSFDTTEPDTSKYENMTSQGYSGNLFDPDAYGTGDYDAMNMPTNIANTADNTDKMTDSLDISSEDLKYLRDIAERDVVNRFTTAEIKVEMTNNNNISSDTDLDGIVNHLVNAVNEAMTIAAEGVPA